MKKILVTRANGFIVQNMQQNVSNRVLNILLNYNNFWFDKIKQFI